MSSWDLIAQSGHKFFAVATEAFYCTPERLNARLPALYERLQRFFAGRSGASERHAHPRR